jgi:F-type H+-transporting ATPase subunit delta
MKISVNQYAKTLLELTDGKTEQEASDIVKKFADILKKDGQLKNAHSIIEKFSEVFNAKHRIVEVIMTTRQKPENQSIKEVEEFVKKKYDAREVSIKNIIDEKIKGGIIIKVGNEIMDASVGGQLRKLKKVLSN